MAVTYTQVKELIPECTLGQKVITSIITDVTNTVTAALEGCTLTQAELDAIIKWYSAHVLASGPCRQAKREKLGEAEVEYNANVGTDLRSTTYGQVALSLDRCGKLNNIGKRPIVIKAVTSFE